VLLSLPISIVAIPT